MAENALSSRVKVFADENMGKVQTRYAGIPESFNSTARTFSERNWENIIMGGRGEGPHPWKVDVFLDDDGVTWKAIVNHAESKLWLNLLMETEVTVAGVTSEITVSAGDSLVLEYDDDLETVTYKKITGVVDPTEYDETDPDNPIYLFSRYTLAKVKANDVDPTILEIEYRVPRTNLCLGTFCDSGKPAKWFFPI